MCAELCGAGHAGMLFRVEAVSPTEWQQWIDQQKSGAPPPAAGGGGGDVAAAGHDLIVEKNCGGCHAIPGVAGANGAIGPDLGGVGGRADNRRWRCSEPRSG